MTAHPHRNPTGSVPVLSLTNLRPGQPLAYIANGLIGLRVAPIPFPGGSALVGGYVGFAADRGTEGLNDAPYLTGFFPFGYSHSSVADVATLGTGSV